MLVLGAKANIWSLLSSKLHPVLGSWQYAASVSAVLRHKERVLPFTSMLLSEIPSDVKSLENLASHNLLDVVTGPHYSGSSSCFSVCLSYLLPLSSILKRKQAGGGLSNRSKVAQLINNRARVQPQFSFALISSDFRGRLVSALSVWPGLQYSEFWVFMKLSYDHPSAVNSLRIHCDTLSDILGPGQPFQ